MAGPMTRVTPQTRWPVKDKAELKTILGLDQDSGACLAYTEYCNSGPDADCTRNLGKNKREAIEIVLDRLLEELNQASGDPTDKVGLRFRQLAAHAFCSKRHITNFSSDKATNRIKRKIEDKMQKEGKKVPKDREEKSWGETMSRLGYIEKLLSAHFNAHYSSIQATAGPMPETLMNENLECSESSYNTPQEATVHQAVSDYQQTPRNLSSFSPNQQDNQAAVWPDHLKVSAELQNTGKQDGQLEQLSFTDADDTADLRDEAWSPESAISQEPDDVFDWMPPLSPEITPFFDCSEIEPSYLPNGPKDGPSIRPRLLSNRGHGLLGSGDIATGDIKLTAPDERPDEMPPGDTASIDQIQAIVADGENDEETTSEGAFVSHGVESQAAANIMETHGRLHRRLSWCHLSDVKHSSWGANTGERRNNSPQITNIELLSQKSIDHDEGLNHIKSGRYDEIIYERQKRTTTTLPRLTGKNAKERQPMEFTLWDTQNQRKNTLLDIIHKMRQPLCPKTHTPGYVYCLRDSSAPGMLKVGFVESRSAELLHDLPWECMAILSREIPIEVSNRMGKLEGECQYELTNLLTVPMTCAARSMESLIHLSLHAQRRKVKKCRKPHCGIDHREWYEVTIEAARRAIKPWYEYSRKVPYYGSGIIRDFWAKWTWSMRAKLFDPKLPLSKWIEDDLKTAIAIDGIEERGKLAEELSLGKYRLEAGSLRRPATFSNITGNIDTLFVPAKDPRYVKELLDSWRVYISSVSEGFQLPEALGSPVGVDS